MAKFCSKCGNELKEGARFCSVCGNPVKQVQSAQSATTAGLWLGMLFYMLHFQIIHRFPPNDNSSDASRSSP